jgi:hypothetical protein
MYYITSKCTRTIAARGSAVSVTFTVRFQTVCTNHLTHKLLYIDIPYRYCLRCYLPWHLLCRRYARIRHAHSLKLETSGEAV